MMISITTMMISTMQIVGAPGLVPMVNFVVRRQLKPAVYVVEDTSNQMYHRSRQHLPWSLRKHPALMFRGGILRIKIFLRANGMEILSAMMVRACMHACCDLIYYDLPY